MKSVNQEAVEQDPQQLHEDLHDIWGNPKGLKALTIVNHTTLGLRFMITGMVFFLIGGILAMLVRTQLAMPDQDFMSPEIYNQVTTMHGTVMMFLFAIPMLE
ncbi:MAG TPA: cytochrome ubiquinol oxidase subunit I, partial [Halomonas sp.]|nr:cytochrome ubiquinol oxidase subunit I [Halomonas sp.]